MWELHLQFILILATLLDENENYLIVCAIENPEMVRYVAKKSCSIQENLMTIDLIGV